MSAPATTRGRHRRRIVGAPPSRGLRLAWLSGLYIVQGLPFGFQVSALPVLLRAEGLSLTALGLFGATTVPWMLKLAWAPFVDRARKNGEDARPRWIVGSLLALAVSWVLLAHLDPATQLAELAIVLIVANTCAATLDIAVDGLAVRTLERRDLGLGNALQIAGYKVGMVGGGGLLLLFADRLGFAGSIYALTVPVLVLAVVSSRSRPDHVDPREPRTTFRGMFAIGRESIAQRAQWLPLIAIATYKLGETMSDVMWKPFLLDRGLSLPEIGLYVGTYGLALSIVGSLAGGLLTSRTSIVAALVITSALRVPAAFAQYLAADGGSSTTFLVIVTGVEHFVGGALTTAMFAFMMSRVDRRIAGTHFTFFATLEAIGRAPSGWVSGMLADAAGYGAVFLASLAASTAFAGLVVFGRKGLRDAPASQGPSSPQGPSTDPPSP